MRVTLALAAFLGLTACLASPVNNEALCVATAADRVNLTNGLLANPQTPDAVGEPAVSILVALSVCP